MSELTMLDIVMQSLALEKKAVKIYHKLMDQAGDDELKTFWSGMRTQESQHVQYWQDLLDIVKEQKILDIFDRPSDVLDELKKVGNNVDSILEKEMDLSEPANAFLTAYRAEFFLLHPAFEAMFFLMRKFTGDTSPEDGYRGHIQGLIEAMRKLGQNRPEFELIAELTNQLWDRNQQLARQMANIKQLHGLLPICMHCKKIRNEEGYWQQVEQYIGDHSEAVFSHGICNDCIEKYYPEIYQDMKNSKLKK
jgi:hypothetical protein